MSHPARHGMTSDEFIAWAVAQPEGDRYELVAGEIVAMAPERLAHALVKGMIFRRLADAVEERKLPCTVIPDGMVVQIDDSTSYDPDVMVRCGLPLAADTIKITDPIIVVEVLSPSTKARDAGAKLDDYFRLPSVRHYLLVKTENGAIIAHSRDDAGLITTRIVREGALRLDPPGIELCDVAAAAAAIQS